MADDVPIPVDRDELASLRARAAEVDALRKEIAKAREYLGRLLTHWHPTCEPLPNLIGVCMQIDNATTVIPTLRARVAVLEGALRVVVSWELTAESYSKLGFDAGYVRDAFRTARAALKGAKP